MWKVQLTIAINFTYSKGNNEERVMHSKSDNIEFMTYDSADKVTEELFESLLNRYQNWIGKTSIRVQPQEKIQSGNLRAAIGYVIARLFRQCQNPQSAQEVFTEECSTLFVLLKIKQYYNSNENH